MKFLINNTKQLNGLVNVPVSKSGTTRGIILASFADFISIPLWNI